MFTMFTNVYKWDYDKDFSAESVYVGRNVYQTIWRNFEKFQN